MDKALQELEKLEAQPTSSNDVSEHPEDPKEILLGFISMVEEGIFADTIVALEFFHEEVVGPDNQELNTFIEKFKTVCQTKKVRTTAGFLRHLLTQE